MSYDPITQFNSVYAKTATDVMTQMETSMLVNRLESRLYHLERMLEAEQRHVSQLVNIIERMTDDAVL